MDIYLKALIEIKDPNYKTYYIIDKKTLNQKSKNLVTFISKKQLFRLFNRFEKLCFTYKCDQRKYSIEKLCFTYKCDQRKYFPIIYFANQFKSANVIFKKTRVQLLVYTSSHT